MLFIKQKGVKMVKTESIRDLVIKEKERITGIVKAQIECKKIEENEYDRYFNLIKKVSNDFELVKTPRNIIKNVIYTHKNNVRTIVDKVSVPYNVCKIIYKGKLPPNIDPGFSIAVEKHIKNSRYGWSDIDLGWKLKLQINYGKVFYYKSIRHFIKNIEDRVNGYWTTYNYEKKIELDKKFALEEAKKRFNPNGDKRFFCTTNNIEITTPKNNIKLRYYVTNENDKRKVSFVIQYIKPDKNLPQKEVDELINFIN